MDDRFLMLGAGDRVGRQARPHHPLPRTIKHTGIDAPFNQGYGLARTKTRADLWTQPT